MFLAGGFPRENLLCKSTYFLPILMDIALHYVITDNSWQFMIHYHVDSKKQKEWVPEKQNQIYPWIYLQYTFVDSFSM